MARILVVGGNFAGITAGLEVKRRLKYDNHLVTVLSMSDRFLYVPSLIWVPFKDREINNITFPVEPILKKRKVHFVHATALSIHPEQNYVSSTQGQFEYDFLILATGPKFDYSLPGLGPLNGFTSCICEPNGALETREAFEKFVDQPGPAVIGATQGAGCVGAAYEFLFNFEFHLRKRNVRKRVQLTWITPEPYLGHFGIDGMRGGKFLLGQFFKHLDINYVINAQIDKITPGEIKLTNGEKLPFEFSMLMPPFLGQDVIFKSNDVGDSKGFIPVTPNYQHPTYHNIFAAGTAVEVQPPFVTPVSLGVPKTGFPAELEAKIAAHNVATLVNNGTALKEKEFGKIPGFCVMDAGHKEIMALMT